MLGCHTRAERDSALARLAEAAAAHNEREPIWIAGAGLCSPAWRDMLVAHVAAIVNASPGGRLPLTTLRERLVEGEPALADLTEEAVEAVAGLAGLGIVRTSIFAAEVVSPGAADAQEPPTPPAESVPSYDTDVPGRSASRSRRAQPRRPAPRKEHDADYATPALLAVPSDDEANEADVANKPDTSPNSDP
jgi:hypothetical protein